MNPPSPVVIIGAGLAGLSCARHLVSKGVPCLVLEASDSPGGRVRTDTVDGFRIDRGFQVILDSYTELAPLLDIETLRPGRFEPGAKVFLGEGKKLATIADPRRRLHAIFQALEIMGPGDALATLRMNRVVTAGPAEDALLRPETTSLARLHAAGYSESAIERFLRPFFAGVMLDRTLSTSSRLLEYYWRFFSEGSACLPEGGMEALPRALAAGLPQGTVRYGVRVAWVDDRGVLLADGTRLDATATVVATDMDECRRLLPESVPSEGWRSTVMIAYDAPTPPVRGPWLVLDGTNACPVNHVAVPSELAKGYAPAGRALVYASSCDAGEGDDTSLDLSFRKCLTAWFGQGVDAWRTLRVVRVRKSLPARLPSMTPTSLERPCHIYGNRFAAGDHLETGSIQGALRSGRRAAEEVAAALPSLHPTPR